MASFLLQHGAHLSYTVNANCYSKKLQHCKTVQNFAHGKQMK